MTLRARRLLEETFKAVQEKSSSEHGMRRKTRYFPRPETRPLEPYDISRHRVRMLLFTHSEKILKSTGKPRTQLIEKTGKRCKAIFLFGAMMVFPCAPMVYLFGAGAESIAMKILGGMLLIGGISVSTMAEMLAWWNHN